MSEQEVTPNYYAVVEDGVVTNVIVATEDFIQSYRDSTGLTCVQYDEFNEDDTRVARIGELYVSGKFVTETQAMDLGLIEDTRPLVVPEAITKVQLMRVLKLHSLWDTFNAILASSQDAMDEWTLALQVERSNQFVIDLAPLLGLTSYELDAYFIEASKL